MLESGFSKSIKLFLSCFKNGFKNILDRELSLNLSSEVDGREIKDKMREKIVKTKTNLLNLKFFLTKKQKPNPAITYAKKDPLLALRIAGRKKIYNGRVKFTFSEYLGMQNINKEIMKKQTPKSLPL